ncbi:Uncharacterized protein Rs2_19863 [Raphanus sativus]|nr:Uncharacterized protein Rs2_19863 [Raphanus sativus]
MCPWKAITRSYIATHNPHKASKLISPCNPTIYFHKSFSELRSQIPNVCTKARNARYTKCLYVFIIDLDRVLYTSLPLPPIWIAASFVVQSVVDAGVSPFLITFICNSLFVVYLPLFEIGRYLEDAAYGRSLLFRRDKSSHFLELVESDKAVLLGQGDAK